MVKTVMISSVGPGGKRTPVSIHRMNGKIKTIWKKGGKKRSRGRKAPKVRVYKVQTIAGPMWRTAISEGGITTTYDTRGSGKQTSRRKYQLGSMMSPKLRKLATSLKFDDDMWKKEAGQTIPDIFYMDTTRAVTSIKQYLDQPTTIKKEKQYESFYDQAAAKAFAKTEYEKGLALYHGGLAWLDAKVKPRFARQVAPTMRGAQRAGRGAARAMGLGGGRGTTPRIQRTQIQAQRAWKSWKQAKRKELQRHKREDLDPYRETWGL